MISTPTTKIMTTNMLLNIVVFTHKSKFMTISIKDFYLDSLMLRYDYMHIAIAMNPQEIIDPYNLLSLIKNLHALVNICKGMYGLPHYG